MNKQEADILRTIFAEPYINQRVLSEVSGYSLGVVNRSLRNLAKEGYVNEDSRPTPKAAHECAAKAPRNAVILAAGFGMRMVPINLTAPKAMMEVRGEPLIERIIRQLHEAGVRDITVVVGFMKEQFDYLIDEYGVDLVVNPEYGSKNNLSSLALVADRLSNTYIVPSDIWCAVNPFSGRELYSWYMVSDRIDEESDVRVNRKMELVRVADRGRTGRKPLMTDESVPVTGMVTSGDQTPAAGTERSGGSKPAPPAAGGNAMIGITYLLEENAQEIRRKLRAAAASGMHDEDFWEITLYRGGKMMVPARVVPASEVVEINTYEQLRELDGESNHLRSDALDVIANVFHAAPEEIVDIAVLKKGMTNRSFLFSVRGAKYIMRIPGEGTDKLIDRAQEAEVFRTISGLGLCDDPVYINPENGFKITAFLEGVRVCDPDSVPDLERCMDMLRRFHGMKLKVGHSFDIFGQIEFYETLRKGQPSVYRDYQRTKANVLSLKPLIEALPRENCLTHIDAVPDNFLFYAEGEGQTGEEHQTEWLQAGGEHQTEQLQVSGEEQAKQSQEPGEQLQLTDWEYAGMQDPHVDIAMFCIYSLYNRRQVDRLIDIYFQNKCDRATRAKIYAYVAACGLLWSNWCEFKRHLGVEFGEYSLRQYRFAKDYYHYAMKEFEAAESDKGV